MSRLPVTRPALYGDRRRWGLLHADSLRLLAMLPDNSIDAVVTDPPYGIGFAGKAWDAGDLLTGDGFTNWTTAWAKELRRVLRPGGYLAAFGAPRTMHRLVTGIEDAGLEIRDQVLWMYGSGMPKSRRLPGDLGTTLKPAYEPVVLARKPSGNTVTATLDRWGTGALNIGDTRVRDEVREAVEVADVVRRWPANLGLVHTLGCTRTHCEGHCAVRQIDEQTGKPIARFFYAAKASRPEREAGLAALRPTQAPIFSGSGKTPRANQHPTVKPIAVMRWLVRLITPRYGVVLDPFCGSGSTGCAALLEDRQFLGVERDGDYIEIARHRLQHWASQPEGPS